MASLIEQKENVALTEHLSVGNTDVYSAIHVHSPKYLWILGTEYDQSEGSNPYIKDTITIS